MFSVFLLFFGVPMTPEVEKNTPWGPGAALANPPLGGLSAKMVYFCKTNLTKKNKKKNRI